jgi:hypothetical protein
MGVHVRWNQGKEYVLSDDNNSNNNNNNNKYTVLYSSGFSPRTLQHSKRLSIILWIWVISLVITPLITLPTVFVLLRTHHLSSDYDPEPNSILIGLSFVIVFMVVALFFSVCWRPVRLQVVQSNKTSVVALVVECVGATYVYDHVHRVYQGFVPSHINEPKSFCSNTIHPRDRVVVVTVNYHIELTPENPVALIRATAQAVAQQQQYSDGIELVSQHHATRVAEETLEPHLPSADGASWSQRLSKNLTVLLFEHPFKFLLLMIWATSVLSCVAIWFVHTNIHPWFLFGLDIALLATSLFLPPFALDISVVAACFTFFAVQRKPGSPSDNEGSGSEESYGNELWLVVAVSALIVISFQGMLLSRLTRSSFNTSPTLAAKWMLVPIFAAVVLLLATGAFQIIWTVLASVAGVTLFCMLVIVPWLVWTMEGCSGQRLSDNKTTRKLLYATITIACMSNQSAGMLADFPSDFSIPCVLATVTLSFAAAMVSLNNGDGFLNDQCTVLFSGDLAPRTKPAFIISKIVTLMWVTAVLITPFGTLLKAAFVQRTQVEDAKDENFSIWLAVPTILALFFFIAIMERPLRLNVVQSSSTIALVVECVGATHVYGHVSSVYEGSIPTHAGNKKYHMTRFSTSGVVVVTANNYIVVNPDDPPTFILAIQRALRAENEEP